MSTSNKAAFGHDTDRWGLWSHLFVSVTSGKPCPRPLSYPTCNGHFLWGGSSLPTDNGCKCSLWTQNWNVMFLKLEGVLVTICLWRRRLGPPKGPILQTPQVTFSLFAGRWGLGGLYLMSAVGVSHSLLPLPKKGSVPRTTFVGVPLPVFSHFSKAQGTDWLVVVKNHCWVLLFPH